MKNHPIYRYFILPFSVFGWVSVAAMAIYYSVN